MAPLQPGLEVGHRIDQSESIVLLHFVAGPQDIADSRRLRPVRGLLSRIIHIFCHHCTEDVRVGLQGTLKQRAYLLRLLTRR